MEQISELMIILGQLLNWNKWRRDCLSKAILSLIKVRNVNLQELAIGLNTQAWCHIRIFLINIIFNLIVIYSNYTYRIHTKILYCFGVKFNFKLDFIFNFISINVLCICQGKQGHIILKRCTT